MVHSGFPFDTPPLILKVDVCRVRGESWSELRLHSFLPPHCRRGFVQPIRLILTETAEVCFRGLFSSIKRCHTNEQFWSRPWAQCTSLFAVARIRLLTS